jgi:kynurenine formamidase
MAAYRVRGAELVRAGGVAGLAGSEAMARFFWDHRFAGVVADNVTIEVAPGSAAVGSLHRRVLPCLGMALGELWDLEELSELAHRDSRFEFFLASAPLNIPGGLGSPANAVAIW